MGNRALVLGGGGVTGVAWEIGLIAGLAEVGIDLAAADIIIGTSAGSIVGADLAAGTDLEALYAGQLAPADGLAPARIGPANTARLGWILMTSRDPERARERMGAMALSARTESEASRRQVFERRFGGRDWPARLRVTAVDAHTGEFVVFDGSGPAALVDAIGASCAVPGVWPPVTIGGRQFIDGGMRSAANADLAAGYDRVVIIAPIAQGVGYLVSPPRQAADLTAAGASVIVVSPGPAASGAIGRNVLDPSRREPAARAGRLQAASVADQIRIIWAADPVAPEDSAG
jgi:NTE family protein